MYFFPRESELVHSSRMKVLNKYVGLLDEFGQDLFPVRSFGVERKRFLVGIKLKKIITWFFRIKLKFVSGGVADTWTFDFDDFSSQPCEHLGA